MKTAKKVSAKAQRTEVEVRVYDLFETDDYEQIAGKLGLNYHTLWNYLKNRSRMPHDVLIKIAELTNCSLNWLLTGEGEKYPSDSPKAEAIAQQSEKVVALAFKMSQLQHEPHQFLSDELLSMVDAKLDELLEREKEMNP